MTIEEAIHKILVSKFPGSKQDITEELVNAWYTPDKADSVKIVNDLGYTFGSSSNHMNWNMHRPRIFDVENVLTMGGIQHYVADMIPGCTLFKDTTGVVDHLRRMNEQMCGGPDIVSLVTTPIRTLVADGKIDEACDFVTHMPEGWPVHDYVRARKCKYPALPDLPPMNEWKICPTCSEYMIPTRESYHKKTRHPNTIKSVGDTIDVAIAKLILKALGGITGESRHSTGSMVVITEPTIVVQCDSKLIGQLIKSSGSVYQKLPLTWCGQNVHLPYTKELALVLRTCTDADNRRLIKKYMKEDKYYETLLIALGMR